MPKLPLGPLARAHAIAPSAPHLRLARTPGLAALTNLRPAILAAIPGEGFKGTATARLAGCTLDQRAPCHCSLPAATTVTSPFRDIDPDQPPADRTAFFPIPAARIFASTGGSPVTPHALALTPSVLLAEIPTLPTPDTLHRPQNRGAP